MTMTLHAPSTPVRVASLAWHDVADDPAASGFQRRGARPYRVSSAEFAAQLDAMAAHACAPVRVTDIDWSRTGDRVLLTFDDGGSSALAIGEELLRRGWRGHFFITTARIGERTFLSADGVRELHRCGHVIGSHSHNHPDIFRELHHLHMLREWRVSRDILSGLLGEPVTTASVPGGDASHAVVRSAVEAGYRFLFTSEPHVTPQRSDDCWVLGRAVLKAGVLPQQVARLASFDGWTRVHVTRALKNSMRRGFPALYRHYVRTMSAE